MIPITNIEVSYEADLQSSGRKCNFELLGYQGNVALYRFVYDTDREEVPEKVTVQWRVPSVNVFSTWNPMARFERGLRTVYTAGILNASRINDSAPIQTLLGQNGKNAITIAVSDTVFPLIINTHIYEEEMDVLCKISFFSLPMKRLKHYEALVRIDMRPIFYYEVIKDVERWWSGELGMVSAKVPKAAKDALYSTWYSYHYSISHEAIIKECRNAFELGMKTIILDAGWQMSNLSHPWSGCGDWKSKNPAVRRLTDMIAEIHGLGMKFILWFSVPFLSTDSEAWEEFNEYVLDNTAGKKMYLLDIRYPQVREYLVGVYERAVKEWNLDGLKLDFINSFSLGDYAKRPDTRRDYESLEEAIEKLLADITERLTVLKEDIMLEFRQSYIGPKARMNCNMLRVGDCPNDALFNRVGLIDLRLLSGETAVHSDMIGWNKSDTPQGCARQLIAVLFGVPQISVKIEELNESQHAVLQFYLDFWNANKDVLLEGELIPLNPEMNYSVVEAQGVNRAITVCYGKNYIQSAYKWEEHTIVNGCDEEVIILDYLGEEYEAEVLVYDCMGKLVQKGQRRIKKELNSFKVPECGMVVVKAVRKSLM